MTATELTMQMQPWVCYQDKDQIRSIQIKSWSNYASLMNFQEQVIKSQIQTNKAGTNSIHWKTWECVFEGILYFQLCVSIYLGVLVQYAHKFHAAIVHKTYASDIYSWDISAGSYFS